MKTILIVEDTDLNIDLLMQLLEDEYKLLIANDGQEGVTMALDNHPDLILMDISLPIMDGYTATRKIRETMNTVPIIGLSANAMQSDVDRALAAGCNDYMTKPFDDQALLTKIKSYLA